MFRFGVFVERKEEGGGRECQSEVVGIVYIGR